MCGRFTLTLPLQDIEQRFHIDSTTIQNYHLGYNIAPGQNIAAVISDGRIRRLGTLKWGLVPFWAFLQINCWQGKTH
ncbi:SOS response-associated peptidase family protein [Salibacterium sp. K-3]